MMSKLTKNRLGGIIGKAVFCVVLASGAVLIVLALARALESRTPQVDLSGREGEVTLLHSAIASEQHLRFAVATMVSAEATFVMYQRLVERICRDVQRDEAFVLRLSYADVRRELEQRNLDVAFVCTGTYVHSVGGRQIKLLVQPEFEKGLDYRSLLIVPAKSSATRLADLQGRVMAFTDPESNTGCLVPTALLSTKGHKPETFFRKIVFTGSHDRSIQAVALGIVDAAAVDSLVWESNLREKPSLGGQVRVIWQSEAFGPPPIVVPQGLDQELEHSIQEAFLKLDQDEEGRKILDGIGIKRFVLPRPADYQTAIDMYETLRQWQGAER